MSSSSTSQDADRNTGARYYILGPQADMPTAKAAACFLDAPHRVRRIFGGGRKTGSLSVD